MTNHRLSWMDLDPDRIRAPFEAGHVGHQVLVFTETSSTIDVARRVAKDPTSTGTVIVADHQTAGRGRHGRDWHSPAGSGLWVSAILDLDESASAVCLRCGWLSILMTMSVIEALRQLGWSELGVRWPNDVVDQARGRKLCGALAEVLEGVQQGSGLRRAILSFGLNVDHAQSDEFPEDVRASAVSLRMLAQEAGQEYDRTRAQILIQILHRLNGLLTNPPKEWMPYWSRYSVLDGAMVQVRSGGREWQGQAIGLERDGSLVMRLSGGRQKTFQSGDVDFLRPLPGGQP